MTLNRHWPNLFKVNPSTTSSQKYEVPNHSDISSQNTGMAIKNEEQNPEPKPRWNPKPEQVQILESIFNSGMKNPSREEIQRIRMSVQQYGEVGDANVFYWFQNRKSRTKQKKRRLEAAAAENPNPIVKRFPSSLHHSKNSVVAGNNASNSIQNNVGGPSYSTLISSVPFHGQYMDQQQKQQIEQISTDQHINIQAAGVEGILSEGTCSDSTAGLSYLPQANSSLLLNEAQSFPTYLDQLQSTLLSSSLPDTNIIHSGDQGEDFITVFIDHVPFRAPRGPVNESCLLGKNAVLFDSSGQQVMMNEWGFSLQGLQNGAMYYLICLYHAYDGYCS